MPAWHLLHRRLRDALCSRGWLVRGGLPIKRLPQVAQRRLWAGWPAGWLAGGGQWAVGSGQWAALIAKPRVPRPVLNLRGPAAAPLSVARLQESRLVFATTALLLILHHLPFPFCPVNTLAEPPVSTSPSATQARPHALRLLCLIRRSFILNVSPTNSKPFCDTPRPAYLGSSWPCWHHCASPVFEPGA